LFTQMPLEACPEVTHGEGKSCIVWPESAAAKLAEDVERVLAALPGVEWAVANSVLGHAVVGAEGSYEIATITDALIEVVEEAHGVTPEHPVSGAAGRRATSAMALHMAAAPWRRWPG
jgi:hypothetical protein